MKKMHKKNQFSLYQIIGIALLCISLIMLTYNTTIAWFRDESITSNDGKVAIIGNLGLTITTNFDFYNLALAPDTIYTTDVNGDDIGTYIKVAPDHDIDGAYVRVRYTCNRPEVTLHFATGMLTTVASPSNNSWVYNESDDFYYYLGYMKKTDTQFNAGYTIDNTLDNTDAYDGVEIILYFETIQRQYGASAAVWTTSPQCFKTYVLSDEKIVHTDGNGA